MRVAITGKGGSGKTVVAALLSRSFARAGVPVLAVDISALAGQLLPAGYQMRSTG